MNKNILILFLLAFLLIPFVFADVSFNTAFDSVMKDIELNPLSTVYRLEDLKPEQSVFEYFTERNIFDSGPNNYFVFLVDYYANTMDGSPKHIIFVNKKTGFVLKIYLEFPPADSKGNILSKTVLIAPKTKSPNSPTGFHTIKINEDSEHINFLPIQNSNNLNTITGFGTATTSICPIQCKEPLLDDRKPAKSFFIFIRGHDHNGAIENSLSDARDCSEEENDEELILSPYYNLGNVILDDVVKSRWVDPIKDFDGTYKHSTGYHDIFDIKKKISDIGSKVCCSDKVTMYIVAHGMAYFTIEFADNLDKETNKLFFEYVDQLLNKYLDSEWEKKELNEEELAKLGLTYEEYYQLSELIPLLAKIYLGEELPKYQLRNLAEAIKLLENKIEFPEWFKKMFDPMIGCLDLYSSGIPEFINECIEKEFKEATNAKIKTRHEITGKKGQDIDTGQLVEIIKEIKSCNKKLIIDSCYPALTTVQSKGLTTIAPSKYLPYVSDGFHPSICLLLEACKEMVFNFFGYDFTEEYNTCMNSIYRCEEPYFGEIANLDSVKQKFSETQIEELFDLLKRQCNYSKSNINVTEQNFQYFEPLECKCCLVTEESFFPEEQNAELTQSAITDESFGDISEQESQRLSTNQQEQYEQNPEQFTGHSFRFSETAKQINIFMIVGILAIVLVFAFIMFNIYKKKK